MAEYDEKGWPLEPPHGMAANRWQLVRKSLPVIDVVREEAARGETRVALSLRYGVSYGDIRSAFAAAGVESLPRGARRAPAAPSLDADTFAERVASRVFDLLVQVDFTDAIADLVVKKLSTRLNLYDQAVKLNTNHERPQ